MSAKRARSGPGERSPASRGSSDRKGASHGRAGKDGRGATLGTSSAGAGPERTARVAERVRTELADMLLRGEVRDPEASGAIVSAVTITNDLSLARVYLRLLDAEPTEARRTALVKALDRAKGHVRRSLASRLDLRTVPELRFAWDDTADRAARLDELLAEVAADRARELVVPAEPAADAEVETGARADDPTSGRGGDGEP